MSATDAMCDHSCTTDPGELQSLAPADEPDIAAFTQALDDCSAANVDAAADTAMGNGGEAETSTIDVIELPSWDEITEQRREAGAEPPTNSGMAGEYAPKLDDIGELPADFFEQIAERRREAGVEAPTKWAPPDQPGFVDSPLTGTWSPVSGEASTAVEPVEPSATAERGESTGALQGNSGGDGGAFPAAEQMTPEEAVERGLIEPPPSDNEKFPGQESLWDGDGMPPTRTEGEFSITPEESWGETAFDTGIGAGAGTFTGGWVGGLVGGAAGFATSVDLSVPTSEPDYDAIPGLNTPDPEANGMAAGPPGVGAPPSQPPQEPGENNGGINTPDPEANGMAAGPPGIGAPPSAPREEPGENRGGINTPDPEANGMAAGPPGIGAPPSESSSGSSGGESRVICTYFYRKGELPKSDWVADLRFTEQQIPEQTVRGYHAWAIPTVQLMRSGSPVGRAIEPLMKFIAVHRAQELAYQMGRREHGDIVGKAIRVTLEPLCFAVGAFVNEGNWRALYRTETSYGSHVASMTG